MRKSSWKWARLEGRRSSLSSRERRKVELEWPYDLMLSLSPSLALFLVSFDHAFFCQFYPHYQPTVRMASVK